MVGQQPSFDSRCQFSFLSSLILLVCFGTKSEKGQDRLLTFIISNYQFFESIIVKKISLHIFLKIIFKLTTGEKLRKDPPKKDI